MKEHFSLLARGGVRFRAGPDDGLPILCLKEKRATRPLSEKGFSA
jgi:hypothetical protein